MDDPVLMRVNVMAHKRNEKVGSMWLLPRDWEELQRIIKFTNIPREPTGMVRIYRTDLLKWLQLLGAPPSKQRDAVGENVAPFQLLRLEPVEVPDGQKAAA